MRPSDRSAAPGAHEPRARRDRPGARAAAALLASALANSFVLAALERAGALRAGGADRPAEVALARVGAGEWEARRRIAGAPASSPPGLATPRPAAALVPEVPSAPIVRVAPSTDPRRPWRARFLAERDNAVKRETQRRDPGPRDAPLAARPTAGADGTQGIPLPGEEGMEETTRAAGREEALEPDASERIARARVALAAGGDVAAAAVSARAAAGAGGSRRVGRFDPRVLPVAESFSAAGRGAPSGDRIHGVPDGDATLVNTRAFRHADFYRRVFDAVRGEWRPNEEWDARDPQDRLLGRQPRKVQLDLVLDPEGRLREARLVRGSGLDFFDRECLRAARAAAPYPNPPRGMVGADGLVVVRVPLLFEWGEETLLDRLLPGR